MTGPAGPPPAACAATANRSRPAYGSTPSTCAVPKRRTLRSGAPVSVARPAAGPSTATTLARICLNSPDPGGGTRRSSRAGRHLQPLRPRRPRHLRDDAADRAVPPALVRDLRRGAPPTAGGHRGRGAGRLRLQQPLPPRPRLRRQEEASICLDPRHRDRGTGTALCTALLEHLTQQPVHLVVAGVALPNEASLVLHRRISFAEVGTFRKCARKPGEWTSSTWFERPL
ncbi:N-acetyltransferase family protein [Falsiroseomonas sp. HC035]|uniref:GNAT family N-acetyltransferase n=1 Tax=Falsiroseomonas sp. HC035 TaxID=3390999 RepID=UPI003D31CA7C